eukprot:tig00020801_g13933.t1
MCPRPNCWGPGLGDPVALLGLESVEEASDGDRVIEAHARSVQWIAAMVGAGSERGDGLAARQRAACAVVLESALDLACRALLVPAVLRALAEMPRGTALVAGIGELALAPPGVWCPACASRKHVFTEAALLQRCLSMDRIFRTARTIERAAVRHILEPDAWTPRPPAGGIGPPATSPPPADAEPSTSLSGPSARPAAVRSDAFRDCSRLLRLLASLGAEEQAAGLRDLASLRTLAARLCRERELDVSHCDPNPALFLEMSAEGDEGTVVDVQLAKRAFASRTFFKRNTDDLRGYALRHLPGEAPAATLASMDRDAVCALAVSVARRLGWPPPDPKRQSGAKRWLEMSDADLRALWSGAGVAGRGGEGEQTKRDGSPTLKRQRSEGLEPAVGERLELLGGAGGGRLEIEDEDAVAA